MSRIEDGFERKADIESKEEYPEREAYPSIELSDKEYLGKHQIFRGGKDNEKSESQISKKKPKKTNPKSNKSAMASL